jgi:hypothetical protein
VFQDEECRRKEEEQRRQEERERWMREIEEMRKKQEEAIQAMRAAQPPPAPAPAPSPALQQMGLRPPAPTVAATAADFLSSPYR